MLDLVRKATQPLKIDSLVSLRSTNQDGRYTDIALKILKIVQRNPGISVEGVKKECGSSQGHASHILTRFLKAGLVSRKSALVNSRRGLAYSVTKSDKEITYIINNNAKLRYEFVMSPMDRAVYNIVVEQRVCRASFIAEKLGTGDSYAVVYLKRLTKEGLIYKAVVKCPGVVKCVYIPVTTMENLQ